MSSFTITVDGTNRTEPQTESGPFNANDPLQNALANPELAKALQGLNSKVTIEVTAIQGDKKTLTVTIV